MPLDKDSLLRQIDYLLTKRLPALPSGDEAARMQLLSTAVEALQGTLTVATALYGANSHQQQLLRSAAEHSEIERNYKAIVYRDNVWPLVQGSLRSMKADIGADLIGSIERRAAGEVFADMLAMAKEALRGDSDGAKNVAAVLAAAAFEDTIRKLAMTLAEVEGRPDLADVLTALKKKGVLAGATFTTAQGYLKFRNDALHADWQHIQAAVVGSCIAFVEHLVLHHLS